MRECSSVCDVCISCTSGIAVKFLKGQAHAADGVLVGANRVGRGIVDLTIGVDNIILVDAVSANTQAVGPTANFGWTSDDIFDLRVYNTLGGSSGNSYSLSDASAPLPSAAATK